jgi:hypothetical protein
VSRGSYIGDPLRSRLSPPCDPRRAFAKVDPRLNPKCETVAFSVSHSNPYVFGPICHASRVELSRKSILVAIQNAKLSRFPCPKDPGVPSTFAAQSAVHPAYRAFAKADPRPNPKCEPVALSVSMHAARILGYPLRSRLNLPCIRVELS